MASISGLGQSPQWAPPALSSVDHDTARAVQPWCPDPASQLGSLNKADGSRGYQAALEQQAMLYAAQGSLQHHAAARLGAGAPDFGQADQFGQADVFGQRDANPRRNTSLQGMYLDPAGGLASNAGRLHSKHARIAVEHCLTILLHLCLSKLAACIMFKQNLQVWQAMAWLSAL